MPTPFFVILVQFNNSEDVISCLKSLKEQTFKGFEAVIVDNASEKASIDHTTSFINSPEAEQLKVTFIRNPENLGYSGGNNIGIKYAMDHGAGEILVLNPDTTADRNMLNEMHLKLMGDDKTGIVGPVIDEGSRKIYGGRLRWLKSELAHSTVYRQLATGDFLTGACLLVRREVFEKVGLYDERYFLYFEDADLCIRVQKAGFQIAIADMAMLQHQVSATTSKLGAAKLLRYHYRNALLFNLKNGPWWIKLTLPFWSFGIIIKQLLKLVVGKQRLISVEILAGVTDFYNNKFGKIQ